MKNSLARAFLQVLALLVGVLVASFVRDRGNTLENYKGLVSTKAGLALGVNGAQSFLVTTVTLANQSLNLAAWMGHQELKIDRSWASVPAASLRVRGEGAAHFELELAGASSVTALRLSNDPLRPSAWLVADSEGTFTRKVPVSYRLPDNKWVNVELSASNGSLRALVDGVALPAFPAPAVPLTVLVRGDSSKGILRVNNLSIRSASASYEQSFEGEIPWAVFLLATLLASMLLYLLERFSEPRIAAGMGGALFLVLCAFFALWTGPLSRRYPLTVDLHGAPNSITFRANELDRLAALPAGDKPLLLWLGGSQAWGAGASSVSNTAFSRLHAALGDLGYDWVNGAVSGATVLDQKDSINAVKRKIGVVVLVTGVNDARNATFTENLSATVAAARARGARVVLIPEPVEPPLSAEVRIRQAEATAFGEREKLPTIPLQAAMDTHADDGFFWWDFVHLSDSGAKFVAGQLESRLRSALR